MKKVTFKNMKSALSSAVKTSALILGLLITMPGNSLKAQETNASVSDAAKGTAVLSDNDAKNLAPIEGKAIVYIVRPSSMGTLVRIGVECDYEGLGSTKAKQYIYAILDPGAHIFTSHTENQATLNLTLEAGKIYFIQQKVKMGIVVARVGLEVMNESDGRKALNSCKLSSDILHGNVELIKNDNSVDISKKFTETANKISVDRTDEQKSNGTSYPSNGIFEFIGFSNDSVKFKAIAETKFYSLALISGNQSYEANMFSNSEKTVEWANGAQFQPGSSMSLPASFGVGAMTLPQGAILTVFGFKAPQNFKAAKIKFSTDEKTTMFYNLSTSSWDTNLSAAPAAPAQNNTVALKQKALQFLNNLNGAVPVKKEDNLIGLSISSVSKSGNDYIVSWASSNELIKNSNSNQAYLLSQIHFIDPENYENNYQPFTIENGKINRTFESGDEFSNQVERVKFEPQSKVMYVYFKGVDKSSWNPAEIYTVPLFFTIVLGDTPYVLEQTPRYAGTMFDRALSAKTMDEQTASNNATTRSETPPVQQTQPTAQSQPPVQNTQSNVQTTQTAVQQTQSTEQRSQPAINYSQQANTQKQIEKFRRWYVKAGLSVGILVPDDVFSTMAPLGGAVGVGFYITPHNLVSFDVNFGSNSPKSGSFSYTKTYTDGSSENFTDGVIYRDYSSTFVMLSYNYIFKPANKYTIRLGASLGTFDMSGSSRYVPQVDNTPIDYSDDEVAAVCGISAGFTWNLNSRWFLDAGYRFLANSGMYIDGFDISAPIHHINLTLGLRF